jgi:hypothetical protein
VPGLNGAHQASPVIAVPSHCNVLLGEAAWAMRRPVDIDGADSLGTDWNLAFSYCHGIPGSFELTTVIVGWCFFAELSDAMRFTNDYSE